MSSDNTYRQYIVAFIDVLGQKASFSGVENLPESKEEEVRLTKAHFNTVQFIEGFRTCFENYFQTFVQKEEPVVKISPERREMFDEMRKCILKHHKFSDCIEAYVPLDPEKYHSVAMNGIYGILAACGGMLLLTLEAKKTFRAGIDIGVGTELSNGEVYGPALFRAHHLESTVAQYPRVVIGTNLINYLKCISERQPQIVNQSKEDIEVCKLTADRCLRMIIQDLDGCHVLDYLGEEFRVFEQELPADKKGIFSELVHGAFAFIDAEYNKLRREKNQKLALRYFQLHSYFLNKVPGIRKTVQFTLGTGLN